MDASPWILLQKKSRIATERNTKANVERREAFQQTIATIPPDKLCFLDESGFSLNLYLAYGWARKNQRCQQFVPLNRGTNRSVLGAFTLSGLVALDSTLGAVRRDRFEAFLLHHVLPVLAAGTVLVLDNARIHHGGNIEQMVAMFGCSLLYLPPYSPELNPIELAWGYLKHLVRGQCPRSDRAREECIFQMAGRIPCPHPEAWFRKCGYNQS